MSWAVCPACGSVVAEPAAHADWHTALAGTPVPDAATISVDRWPGTIPAPLPIISSKESA